jgi:hypothetical protein
MQPLFHNPSSDSENVSLDALANKLHYAISAIQAGIGKDSVLARRFLSLNERLQDKRLRLAVLGQFKRGKSTFINALIGAPLLPVAVVPLTAVPVFIAWREAPFVQVRFKNGRPPEELAAREADAIRNFLFRFVAEEANQKNHLGVKRSPAPLNKSSMARATSWSQKFLAGRRLYS